MPMFLNKLSFVLLFLTQILSAYSFTMQIDNTNPIVGEKVNLNLQFGYDNLEEYNLEEPDYEAFNIALVDENETKQNNGTWLVAQHYTLVPKKAGAFTLPPLNVHIESIPLAYQDAYNKNHYLQKQDITTQAISMQVAPLPQGIEVTGDYTLQSSIDKNQTTNTNPVQFTLTLEGEGNIDNLKFLTLHIPYTTIYETNTARHSKTFSILANQDYTIPPIVLKYFKQKDKAVTITSTPSYAIHIRGTSSMHRAILWGLFLLLVMSALYGFWVLSRVAYLDTKRSFIKQLKTCQNRGDLLKKVAPYMGKSRRLDRLIYRLDGCEGGKFKVLKREIIKHFYHQFTLLRYYKEKG